MLFELFRSLNWSFEEKLTGFIDFFQVGARFLVYFALEDLFSRKPRLAYCAKGETWYYC